MTLRRGLLCCVVLAALPAPVHAQRDADLERLIEEAAKLPAPEVRYLDNIKVGVRGVTFTNFAQSPSHPETFYVTSWDGYVYSTHDGGISWSEARLTSQRLMNFFGAFRPSPAPSAAPFNLVESLAPAVGAWVLWPRTILPAFNPWALLDVDEKIWGVPAPPFDPTPVGTVPFSNSHLQPNLFDKDLILRRFGFWDQGGHGGGGDAQRLGVGLKVAAPRLAALLAWRRLRTATMNLKRTLAEKGTEPTFVGHVGIHPTNPKIAFASSMMGLFYSEDGGISWQHVFPGTNNFERDCVFVAFHPKNPRRVFLGTGQGLRVSENGGVTWASPMGTMLSDARTHWMDFYQKDPDIMYAGTNIGVFRSDDGGATWRWVFFETLPTQNDITGIVVHPEDPDRVILSTADGLYQTKDGGDRWVRSGGLLFTGNRVQRLAGNSKDGDHLACIDWRQAWETKDGGETWSTIYINDSEWTMRSLGFDRHNAGTLWLQTSNELLRLSPEAPPAMNMGPEVLQKLRVRFRREPSMPETMDAAFRAYGVHRGERADMRAMARWRGLVPVLNVAVGHRVFGGKLSYEDEARGIIPDQPYITSPHRDQNTYVAAILDWDLQALVFHQELTPFGRMFYDANKYYLNIKYDIQRLYEERRRVLVMYVTRPNLDFRSRLLLKLRLEELTAHLNALSNGLWDDAVVWVENLE